MPAEQATADNQDASWTEQTGWLSTVFLSPLLWGGLLSVTFYTLIPFLPVQRDLAIRYFCSHPLEYVTTALFFIGIATVGIKGTRLSAEKAAMAIGLLEDAQPPSSAGPLKRVALIEKQLQTIPSRMRKTFLVRRISDVCAYVRGRRSNHSLEEHLKYLADLASEQLHHSYALVRNITWAVPILGFLGTVVGITMAIANVTPEQLDTSLSDVTSGLAIAFDTTALALTLSLLLVFASFVVERSEQRILSHVEEFGIKRVVCLFPSPRDAEGTLVHAEYQAAEKLLEQTESLINSQTQLWHEGLESLRLRWTETLEIQKQDLDQTLQQGMKLTLDDHAQQLSSLRGEFLQASQQVSQEFSRAQVQSRQFVQDLQRDFGRQLADVWRLVKTDIAALRDDQVAQVAQLMQSLSEQMTAWQSQLDESTRDSAAQFAELFRSLSQHVTGWQAQLNESTQAGTLQLEELRKQGEVLLSIMQQEELLTKMQDRLSQNLESIRAAETFEETMHSLSAAIHLLTTRVKPKAA